MVNLRRIRNNNSKKMPASQGGHGKAASKGRWSAALACLELAAPVLSFGLGKTSLKLRFLVDLEDHALRGADAAFASSGSEVFPVFADAAGFDFGSCHCHNSLGLLLRTIALRIAETSQSHWVTILVNDNQSQPTGAGKSALGPIRKLSRFSMMGREIHWPFCRASFILLRCG
jgi:hypothetical protein